MAVEREKRVFSKARQRWERDACSFPSRRQYNRCVHGVSFILIITGGACHIIERPIEI